MELYDMKKGITILLIAILTTSSLLIIAKPPAAASPLNSQFIYYGGDNVQKVYQAWSSNMTKRAESINYGGRLRAFTSDGVFLYIGGYSPATVWKLWASNLTKVAESKSVGTIFTLLYDGTFIYASGEGQKIYKFWASNLTEAQESMSLGYTVMCTSLDANYIYAVGGADYESSFLYQFWRSNLTARCSTTFSGGTSWGVITTGKYVYMGTSWPVEGGVIKRYNPADLSYLNQVLYGGTIYTFAYDGTYLYAGGHDRQTVVKYTEGLALVAESQNYGGALTELRYDGTYLYVSGLVTDKVWKLDPATMQKISETPNYGGAVESLWTSPAITTLELTLPKHSFRDFSVSTMNTGNDYALNVELSFTIKGGMTNKINVTSGSSVDSLNAAGVFTHGSSFPLGFGRITVTASAKALNAFAVEKTATGFILGPFIFLK
jgi:hypothetical protein